MARHPRADALIRALRLDPHIEGGFYREVFRSSARVIRTGDQANRSALTSIYFLLPGGTVSRWHRVTADEVWHLYEGDGLDLFMAPPGCAPVQHVRLGRALDTQGPSATVPAGWWQAARPAGPYALAGCTVGPGFEFADFRFLRDDEEALAAMTASGTPAVDLL
jgi:predicted cupin superfamily sugar epimerase